MLNFENVEINEEQQKVLNDQVSALIEQETGGLKSKVEELLSESKANKAKAKETEKAAALAAEEAAKKAGDIDSLEKSWTDKFNAQESEYKTQIETLMGTVRQDKVESVALQMAAKLSGDKANAILPHIQGRLDVELVDGSYKTIVKDNNGGRSALTVEELEAELKQTEYLAPLIIASGASGAGTGASKTSGGATGSKLTPEQEMAQRINKKFGK